MIPARRISRLRSFSWVVLLLFIFSVILVVPVFLSYFEFTQDIKWYMLDYDYEDIPIGRIQNNLIISFVVALIASMLLSCMAEVILQGLRVNDDIDAVGMKAKRKLYIPIVVRTSSERRFMSSLLLQ